ncbi:MAG: bifunctional chorismate mutase/prephenate dehydratase [Tissierellia bacterium]|jgi:chorismate mutase/prephenate dehydratase|nr:prephenate dehydratase domain-containing protein [Bacillota bacterium]NLK57780.1 bifunctional chorismate mutase/prephenate dehydratase [Tissierellia bacterium]
MELQDIRNKIDRVDDEIFTLFAERMALAREVAKEKKKEGTGIRNRMREREILQRQAKKDPQLATYTRMLYNTLFSVSKSLQWSETNGKGDIREKIRFLDGPFPREGVIAVQGTEGSYSQQAAERMFPMGEVMFFRTFADVFQAVKQGLCDFGVVPIENSSNGSVKEVFEVLSHYDFSVVRETKLFIDHRLLVKPGVKLEEIREIFSQRQALGQCSDFLLKHPEIRAEEYMDTAMAAAFVANSERRDVASLSSKYCAELYGLEALPVKIQNSENNYTRFLCITKDVEVYPGSNKISLMVSAPHEPGGLYHILARFAALGLNITKLESRSISGQDFEFNFYFDFEGSLEMPEVRWLMQDLRDNSERFQFLGNYQTV